MALVVAIAAAANYTVLHDTDFYGFNSGSLRTSSFEDCAAACEGAPPPSTRAHDHQPSLTASGSAAGHLHVRVVERAGQQDRRQQLQHALLHAGAPP